MLEKLTVRNLAVVEAAEIAFGPGLNVITGETGAGKSVLMGALDLALGARAGADVVRDGAKEAEVEAVLGGHVVRRTVTREGRSRAWIDEESVSVAELREFGAGLVDVNGPRASQDLLGEGFQRAAIDEWGGIDLAPYRREYDRLVALRARREEMAADGGEDELDMLRFQVDELAAADVTDDDDDIAARHAAAAHAGEIVENANAVMETLGGDNSVADLLASTRPALAAIARHLPAAAEWSAAVDDISARVEDLSRSIADAVSGLDLPEESLQTLDDRLTLLNRLERKYLRGGAEGGGTLSERLLAALARRRERLDALENRDEALAALDRDIAAAEAAARKEGAAVTAARTAAGRRFAKAVAKELRDLGFLKAEFSVAVDEGEMSEHGLDRVVYMFGPNPGEPIRPLAAIASSGEIARAMLAVKAVMSSRPGASARPTLVFDEIDANIGGETGRAVGEKLRRAAERGQVIAITHLPQSAAYGDRHFAVAKKVSAGRTRTEIKEVKGEARVAELARMMGGEGPTDAVRRHAQELAGISG